MRQYTLIFVVMAAWDWLATASVRFIADGSLVALPLASALTLFLWLAVLNIERSWRAGAVACVAAAAGTALGLYVP